MKNKENDLKSAMYDKNIPILTIDNKWHKLCSKTEKNKVMIECEKKLNELLCEQGKINSQLKSVRPLKKKLLEELVEMASEMEINPSKNTRKKIEEHKILIAECNEKLDVYRDELLDLPISIKQINETLMFETMKICYQYMETNNKEIEVIDQWLSKIRIELKKNVIKKQEIEKTAQDIYSYMHDIFGADVIELFDFKYDIVKKNES